MTEHKPPELPSSIDLRPEFDQRLSNAPEKIRQIIAKGQGEQDCCVAFVEMVNGCYRGTWGNSSMRFLHCVCKMIDDGTPAIGTTMTSGIRAIKGWGTCDEDLWPSNVDLSKSEFENWKGIPKEAWENAKLKRIQKNKRLVSTGSGRVVKSDGREFHLFTNAFNALRSADKQFELLVIDSEFETVAWATLRAYVEKNQIVLEDLFVKSDFRRMHLGARLLFRIEQIACLEKPFSELNHEILAPITTPDAGPTRYDAVKDFFKANGYECKNTEPIRKSLDYSIYTATKRLECAAIRNNYALELAKSERSDKAVEQLAIAVQLDPTNARIHTNHAIMLLDIKDYVGAEDQLNQALQIDDQNALTYSVYGNLTRELRRDAESEKHYLRALELKEDFPRVHNNYGNLLRRMGRPADAEKHFQRALEIEEFPETHYSYALLLVDLKRNDDAEIHFKRALELRREFPEANNGYAKLLFALGRPEESEKYYRHAIEYREDYADAHAEYAYLLGNLKRYDESEKHYLRAIEINEMNAKWTEVGWLHGELGAVYEEHGKLEQSEAHLEEALEISKKIGQTRLQSLASEDLARVQHGLKKTGR